MEKRCAASAGSGPGRLAALGRRGGGRWVVSARAGAGEPVGAGERLEA